MGTESPNICKETAFCVHSLHPKVHHVKPHFSNVLQVLTIKPLVNGLQLFSFCLFYFAGFVIFLINVPKSPTGENDYSSIYPLFGNPEKYAYKLKSLKFDLFISKTISLALCIFTNSSCWQPFMSKIVEQLHCVCEFKIYMDSTILGTHHNVCKA